MQRPRPRPGPGSHAQLAEDVVDVGLGGALGDDEPGGDLAIAQSLGEQAGDLLLVWSGRQEPPPPPSRWAARRGDPPSPSPSASATASSKEYDAPSAKARSKAAAPTASATASCNPFSTWAVGAGLVDLGPAGPPDGVRCSQESRPLVGRGGGGAQDSAWTPNPMPVRSWRGWNSRTHSRKFSTARSYSPTRQLAAPTAHRPSTTWRRTAP